MKCAVVEHRRLTNLSKMPLGISNYGERSLLESLKYIKITITNVSPDFSTRKS